MKRAYFTIDVEDYEDITSLQGYDLSNAPSMMDGFDRLLGLLRKEKVPVTHFVLASRLDRSKERLKKAIEAGDAIGVHGLTHELQGEKDVASFKASVSAAKKRIEEELGCVCLGYRAPGFDLSDDKLNELKELGFAYDSSKFDNGKRYPMFGHRLKLEGYEQVGEDHYVKDGFHEFAMPVASGFMAGFGLGGGIYPRFFPFLDYKVSLKQYLKTHDTFVFYCHPFEFSLTPCPKIAHLDFPSWYYSHVGRKRYLRRVARIIRIVRKQGFEFTTFERSVQD